MPESSRAIQFERSANDVYVSVLKSAKDTTAEQIKTAFEMSRFAEALLVDENVFEQVIKNFKQWQLSEQTPSSRYSERIATLEDARLYVIISDDHMTATLSCDAAQGGTPIERQDVLEALKGAGVVAGIKRKMVDKVINHAQNVEPGSHFDAIIARGVTAKNGHNAWFERLVDDARQRVLRPQAREDGTVDMRDLGEQVTVLEGDPLLRKHPPTKGRHGCTVKGDVIEAFDGEDTDMAPGEGARFDDNDPMTIIAARTGMPWFTHNSASVDDVLTLKTVDVSTGHVKFKGSVIVTGNVTEGMRVECTGDITVAGYVDSAHLFAGGSITVRKGCIGHISSEDEQRLQSDEAYIPHLSSKLHANDSIWCAYAQYAFLKCNQSLTIDRQLTHCHVVCLGEAFIGGQDNSARGKIIGGTFETCAHICAGQLGARAGTLTRFILSVPPPPVSTLQALSQLYHQLRAITSRLRRVEKGITRCQSLANSEQQKSLKHSLVTGAKSELERLRSIQNDLKVMRASLKNHTTLRIMAAKEVFPGVQLEYDHKKLRIKEHRGGTLLLLKDHELRMDILR